MKDLPFSLNTSSIWVGSSFLCWLSWCVSSLLVWLRRLSHNNVLLLLLGLVTHVLVGHITIEVINQWCWFWASLVLTHLVTSSFRWALIVDFATGPGSTRVPLRSCWHLGLLPLTVRHVDVGILLLLLLVLRRLRLVSIHNSTLMTCVQLLVFCWVVFRPLRILTATLILLCLNL
jgi:hypothetical protein